MSCFAKESEKLAKARRKLCKKLESIEKIGSRKSLNKKSDEIKHWIGKYSQERIVVKEKVSLFDENQNSAESSQDVMKIYGELSKFC